MIQGYAIPNATMLGNNGAYKSQFYKALEGAKAAGATVEEAPCLLARGVEAYNDGLPSTPSLLIVPQFYKAGNLYQDVPPFVAEDTTMRFTVSRNTTATRVNASGLIESVASGLPRIDWFGQSCPALLVEASGQNLAFHSESWDNGNNWQLSQTIPRATRVTGSTDAFKAPDGTFTANGLSPTSGNVAHYFYSNSSTQINYTSGTIYTLSAFFKAGTGEAGRYIQITTPFAAFSQQGYANYDLQLGTVAVVSGVSADTNRVASIENYGNGWYRCRLTATCTAGGSAFGIQFSLITASGSVRVQTFAGTVTDVLYGWGAQVETGSIATTYIPTTTAAVSRADDVINASGALVSGLIGQTEGTMYAKVDVRNDNAGLFLSIDDGDISDFIIIVKTATLAIRAQIRRANGSPASIITSSPVSLGVHKIALSYTNGDYALYIDGVSAGTSTNSTDYPATSLTRCVFSAINYFAFNDRIRAAALYTTRLSNDQLAELTRL